MPFCDASRLKRCHLFRFQLSFACNAIKQSGMVRMHRQTNFAAQKKLCSIKKFDLRMIARSSPAQRPPLAFHPWIYDSNGFECLSGIIWLSLHTVKPCPLGAVSSFTHSIFGSAQDSILGETNSFISGDIYSVVHRHYSTEASNIQIECLVIYCGVRAKFPCVVRTLAHINNTQNCVLSPCIRPSSMCQTECVRCILNYGKTYSTKWKLFVGDFNIQYVFNGN